MFVAAQQGHVDVVNQVGVPGADFNALSIDICYSYVYGCTQ